LVLVIRPPSLLWESYVRPPTESQTAHCIVTGNNYWDTGTAPGKSPSTHPPRHRASGRCTGEVWERRSAGCKTLTGLWTLSSLRHTNGRRSIGQRARIPTDQNKL
jgi:hypothetical protein